LDASGASSRAQLVTPLSPSPPINNNTFHHTNVSQNIHYPSPLNSSFSQNIDRHHRSSRSEFDLHSSNNNNIINGIDPRHHASIPYRIRPGISYENPRGYDTIDYNYDGNRSQRRSLPKSFSDCDLCKRRVVNEEHQQYFNEQNDNWHLENNSSERKIEPRTYRDRIKERFRDRVTTHQIPDSEHLSPLPPMTTTTAVANVEYSTVVPRHQRIASETNRSVHHLPFEYIPNDGNNLPVKYYEHSDDERKSSLNRRLNDTREIQEISMRMNDQQNFNRHQYYHHQ
jgi:hypothetical protein